MTQTQNEDQSIGLMHVSGAMHHDDTRIGKQSLGEFLQLTRNRSGISITMLSNRLKVSIAKLEALEANHFDQVGDTVFVRALALSICRLLQVDINLVQDLLPEIHDKFTAKSHQGSDLGMDGSGNDVFTTESFEGLVYTKSKLPISFIAYGLLVLISIILGTILLYKNSGEIAEYDRVDSTTISDEAIPDIKTASGSTQTPTASHLSVASETMMIQTQMLPASAVQINTSEIDQKNSTDFTGKVSSIPILDSQQEIAKSNSVSKFELNFVAEFDSWIKVSDSKGQVLFSGLLKAGQSQQLMAPTLSQLVIGNAAGIRLQINGKDMDISTIAKNNVVRIELK